MTEEKKITIEPERYQHALAAAQFIEQENSNSARKCLEKLTKDMGIVPGSDAYLGLVWNVSEDSKGWMNAINIYASKYHELFGAKTVSSLFDKYDDSLKKYLDKDEMIIAKEIFDSFKDEKYGDIQKKVVKAEETIKSKTGNFSEDQKKAAQKVIEKYAPIVNTINGFQSLKIQSLMLPANEESMKDNLKEMFKKKDKKEK